MALPNRTSQSSFTSAGNIRKLIIFGIFICFGSMSPYLAFFRPLTRWALAMNWVQTPCTVLTSEIIQGENPKWNRLNLTYSYSFGGRSYTSHTYGVGQRPNLQSNSFVSWCKPGLKTVCYVNPSSPGDAMFICALPPETAVTWLLLVFPLIGVIGILHVRRSVKGGWST